MWLLLPGPSLELWAGQAEAAEVETAPAWVGLLFPSAAIPRGHLLTKGAAFLPCEWYQYSPGRPQVTYKNCPHSPGLSGAALLVLPGFLNL